MIGRVLLHVALLVSIVSPTSAESATASYHVRMLPASLRLSVSATIAMSGSNLLMDASRPAGIPELDSLGWSGLVSRLRVTDASGQELKVAIAGENRWMLAEPHAGPIGLEYDVDYSILARHGWPAPREAAYADSNHLVLVGRSLFITAAGTGASEVTFDLPKGWRPVTAWRPRSGSGAQYDVPSRGELVENLCVLTRSDVDEVLAGEFRLHVIALGHWQSSRPAVRRILEPVVRRYEAAMVLSSRVDYVVVLLPQLEGGAESYRSSFALTIGSPSSAVNSSTWGNTVAHEIFHVWNGWRLHGEDYASSQWFQEGFTEYTANATMVRSDLLNEDEFLRMLSRHVQRYRTLTTTFENIGTRKGPPLYSGGALIAFSWDAMIRSGSVDGHTLADFWRELLRGTGDGKRAYRWTDIREALARTAPGDWEAYYQAHIRGDTPLPLVPTLALVGLRLVRGKDGSERIEADPASTPAAKALWRDLVMRD